MWRDTMLAVRLGLAGALVFSALGWLGLSLPALVRTLRRLVAGRTRPAVPFRKKRRFA